MRLFQPEQPPILQTMMFHNNSRTPQDEVESSDEEETHVAALSQRSGVPATHIVLVVAAPFFLVPCATSTPRTFPRDSLFSSRNGYSTQPRRRTWERSLRHMTVVLCVAFLAQWGTPATCCTCSHLCFWARKSYMAMLSVGCPGN